MAARTPVEILRDEACCSICLEIFQNPVSIHCGHSFCQSCITRSWEGLTTNFSCPQCGHTLSHKTLRPNRELANISEAAKSLNLQQDRDVEGRENLCEKHHEPLKLFCKDEERLICLVCDRSKVHRDHSVVPMGEASQEYKLEKKFSDFTEKNPDINELLEKFQDVLKFEFLLTTQMTLDPETAHPRLYLSQDCKHMRWEGRKQDLPSNHRRFKVRPCVLGSRGFTSGCHHWDVEICREGLWAIGVVKELVPRGLWVFLNPNEGVWALRHNRNEYLGLTSPNVTRLTLRSVPKRIRICLDYEKGRVVFFDAESKERIFAFPPASFQGERVFPWFMLRGDAQLKLLP
ncbi:E3 ubiquitin-protein ligase TRIM39-like [Numenius arquata]|uniref:E3 ubiquitin-protein ligase TRIM39-like n=1 Tax=Numenius arquata TaxID=31919 RepID=UPI003D30C22A